MISSFGTQYLTKPSQGYEYKVRKILEVITNCAKDKIAFIFLFGSFDENHNENKREINYNYASTYNFLIITKNNKQLNGGKSVNLERKIQKEIKNNRLIYDNHSPNYIIESINLVNSKVAESQYFFSNVRKAGTLLFDSGEFQLSESKKLNTQSNNIISRNYYNHWMSKAEEFIEFCIIAFEKEYLIKSIFELHQATESLYNCTLLTLVGYKPKSHDLQYLCQLCSIQSNQFLEIFPLTTNFQKQSFSLLQKSYIDSRYNSNFKIDKKQLEYLITRVRKLERLVKDLCKKVLV